MLWIIVALSKGPPSRNSSLFNLKRTTNIALLLKNARTHSLVLAFFSWHFAQGNGKGGGETKHLFCLPQPHQFLFLRAICLELDFWLIMELQYLFSRQNNHEFFLLQPRLFQFLCHFYPQLEVVDSYDSKTILFCFKSQRFMWDFILADVARPILGADFLVTFNLSVDIAQGRVSCFHFYSLCSWFWSSHSHWRSANIQ